MIELLRQKQHWDLPIPNEISILECSWPGFMEKEIKKTILKHNPNFVLIQETKRNKIDRHIIKSIWSSSNIGWASLDAAGSAGGILILWSDPDFKIGEIVQGQFSVSLHVTLSDDFSFWLSSIYGPSTWPPRKAFWRELNDLAGLGGDQ